MTVTELDVDGYYALGDYGRSVIDEWWLQNTGERMREERIVTLTISASVALAERVDDPPQIDPTRQYVMSRITHHWLSSPLPGTLGAPHRQGRKHA